MIHNVHKFLKYCTIKHRLLKILKHYLKYSSPKTRQYLCQVIEINE